MPETDLLGKLLQVPGVLGLNLGLPAVVVLHLPNQAQEDLETMVKGLQLLDELLVDVWRIWVPLVGLMMMLMMVMILSMEKITCRLSNIHLAIALLIIS